TQRPFGETVTDSGLDSTPIRFPGQYADAETGLHYNYFRDYDPSLGRYVTSDPIGLLGGENTYGYVGGNPGSFFDPYGLAQLPSSPDGLGNGWTKDTGHRNPNGEKWNHDSGASLEWHPGQEGKPGWRGKDHWHLNGGKEHLPPGTDIPDLPIGEGDGACPEDSSCRKVAGAAALGAAGYIAYRCIRMIPSLLPPFWPTIPANVAIP
ncbi:MAG: RHS repeat-associated core domain-containing protein, partial [Pseudomonadota bacterium]